MDPDQQQHLAAMMASMGIAVMFFGLIVMALGIFLFWRIFTKAGMAGALSLLILVPGIGWVVCLCILAFGQWRVVPAPSTYASGPPSYPPPAYPPTQL